MKQFFSWLAGIAATVIAGVLIYHWTTPPPAPAPAPEMEFEGMVIDEQKVAPVKGALVSFEAEGASEAYHDFTDDNGSYAIKLSGLSGSSRVTVHFEANGYRKESKVLSPLSDDNRYDQVLKASPAEGLVASPKLKVAEPTSTPVSRPPAQVTLPYIRKLSVQSFHIQPAKKK